MPTLNHIGLDTKKTKKLAKKLDLLLANYQLFYMNVRGVHWNIRGKEFFELHLKFEELYNDSFLKIDEIAERILTLGETPNHTYEAYLKLASIPSAKNITDGSEALRMILKGYEVLLPIEREILELSAAAGDEGTNSQMSDYIREQEKLIWMYSAYLGK